jgi:hypothetical protein
MRLAWLSLALVSLACGSAGVVGPKLPPSEVAELGALPPGYEEGEGLRATCTVAAPVGAFDDETLGDVDCNFARLSRVLRARAGERSAGLLVGKMCEGSGVAGTRLSCAARLAWRAQGASAGKAARPPVAPAPSPAQVLDIDDPRPQDSERIRVSFEPGAAAAKERWPARAYDRVAETAFPPVGRRVLGNVSARCESCRAESLRYALRVTAGRAGAGEVSSVKCFEQRPSVRCVATAFVPWSS